MAETDDKNFEEVFNEEMSEALDKV